MMLEFISNKLKYLEKLDTSILNFNSLNIDIVPGLFYFKEVSCLSNSDPGAHLMWIMLKPIFLIKKCILISKFLFYGVYSVSKEPVFNAACNEGGVI